ncbi:hypothetical protein [Amycolatopsis nalaikhensis]|uniref:K Homology domain-containing protein n=1 Tax=Amycolatopsis nalaikhensis TaxID=715472 RepID=A0ABY8XQ84_9PSEU|nr:hypothetical protein [Amycolatopsis sp. 2-2]WIV57786.1 hypothetical protein QP939_03625 [Amycolatopsis sp. 2-2]
MTEALPVDVELVMDVRHLPVAPTDAKEYGALWAKLEPALVGRNLRAKKVHQLTGADGSVRLEVVRIADGLGVVSPATRFSIVAVRESAQLRYRCRQCSAEGTACYGPFPCSVRDGGAEHRVCDAHVSILDGSLTATCAEHRPTCRDCGQPATFRCAGEVCHRERAWCDDHRRPHPRDRDVDFCPSCYDREFPRCEAPGCQDIGTVTCEHASPAYELCRVRMCTRHARRWQVFGGERMGLGRCSRHAGLGDLSAEQLMFQIVVGASARRRRQRLPSLQGIAHTLRNGGHAQLALDYRKIHSMLGHLAGTLGRGGPRAAIEAMAEMQRPWDRQLQDTGAAAQEGLQLVEKLKQLVLAEDRKFGQAIAAALSLAEFKPAVMRSGRPTPVLFVNLADDLRGLFIGKGGIRKKAYAARLGVEIEFEGGRRRR